MSAHGFRRRKILVDKHFQLGISFRVVFCLACYLLLFYLMAVFAPFLVMVLSGGREEAMLAATRQVVTFVDQLLLPLGLTFACLALHCILISHKVAGPLFRFGKFMESATNRDISEDIRLRDGDYLPRLAADWNVMVGSLRRDIEALRGGVREILAEARSSGGSDEGARRRILDKGERLIAILEDYRTGSSDVEDPAADSGPQGEPGVLAEESRESAPLGA
jgi:hypothetical protein